MERSSDAFISSRFDLASFHDGTESVNPMVITERTTRISTREKPSFLEVFMTKAIPFAFSKKNLLLDCGQFN
jgi:hypothetical protein